MGTANHKKAFLLVAALILSSVAFAQSNVDFFSYRLTWPGSYCRQSIEGCCLPTTGKPALDFFVNGLYATGNCGQTLTKCNTTKFYVNTLAKLIGDMYLYMPSIKCPSNNGLNSWKHLWINYGICSGLDERQYFNTSLLLRSRINLLPKLRQSGFPPTDRTTYSSGILKAAIDLAVGVRTTLRCSTNLRRQAQLAEVRICVKNDATTLINCPASIPQNCPKNIAFPRFTYSMLRDTSLTSNPIKMPTYLSEY